MRAGDEVVVFDLEIADRRGGHVQAQRLPVVAVVERHVDVRFGAREEQPLLLDVFPDGAERRAGGDAVHDLRPRRAAVVRAEEMRVLVVDAQRVDRRVGRERIEAPGLHHEDLPVGADLFRRHVLPVQSSVPRHRDDAVVGAHPDGIDVLVGRPDRVDDPRAVVVHLRLRLLGVLADALRHLVRLAREVRADLFPVDPAVHGLPQDVGREEQRSLVHHRKDDRLRANLAVHDSALARRSAPGREGGAAAAERADVRHLSRPPVVARDFFRAVDDVGVLRVGSGVAVLFDRGRMPLARRDLAVDATARDASGSAVLLPAADAVGERVVGRDVIHRGRRLVVPAAPARALVERDDRSLVRHEEDEVPL